MSCNNSIKIYLKPGKHVKIFFYQRNVRLHYLLCMAKPYLSNLPDETLGEIQASLSYASQLALRLTCRELHAKLTDPDKPTTIYQQVENSPIQQAYDIYDLLEIEQWPAYTGVHGRPEHVKQPIAGHDFFACSLCLKLRSASKFSNAMMKGKRGKLGSGTVEERRSRFCIPCGVAQDRYRRGTQLQYGGAGGGYGFVCLGCGSFNGVGYSFERASFSLRLCDSCYKQSV